METDEFDDKLSKMTKPEVSRLKHQDMLADAISGAKDKSVLSFWWLGIPLYITAAVLMKTSFMPGTTFLSNLHEVTSVNGYSSLLIFVLVPVLFIILNSLTIRKIFFLSGSPRTFGFFEAIWFNILIIIASVFLIIIYLI